MPSSARVGYARVSTTDQNLARQITQLESLNLDKLFTDTVSGKNTDRPGFKAMMDYLREGDALFICSMDRLARNLEDLLGVTKLLQKRGVSVFFIKENLSLDPSGENSAISKLLLSMMGAVAEFERSLIRERQREGIAIAKQAGKYKGRAPLDPHLIEEAKRLQASGLSMTRIAKDLKLSRSVLYKYLEPVHGHRIKNIS